MIYLLLALVGLGIIAAVFELLSRKKGKKQGITEPPASGCSSCIEWDPSCEQECMVKAAVKEIEYFDDEELDRFKGRPSDQYTDAEIEEFSEVMNTMKPEEARDWSRSLILRGIQVPDQIKDELIELIKDSGLKE
ncbi:MAG: hypothetical protein LKI18_10075 [Prevotella sp.]|jgi:hypothetical protein|nr:hypothetical protein [Prevotella sp.]MCI1742663.1 hypothetical protein [Prevotella sp.]